MRLQKWNAILFTGLVWLTIGFFLTMKGLKWIVYGMPADGFLCKHLGSVQHASLVLIMFSLMLGFIKGRFVMVKTIQRVVRHILSQEGCLKTSSLYPKSYYIILTAMIFLGITCKFLPIPKIFLGFIDLTIGSALINGAMLYLRYSLLVRAEKAPF